ncbi:hypothetical protein [Butyrivibrio hungatei]|uniref:Uncharacterized protein n=1 Tax=Butyrivibrio hungatei TaxID=185008 RepID=A0A1D9NYR3_9FIRM|nr:hypothetical protein [Butyrivibrio hungatei]AOZ95468.1 hypothetical protein bhn_I0434 [Butyrivibrio hungatei]
MEATNRKNSIGDKINNILLYWVIISNVMIDAPIIVTMAMHKYFLCDFDINNFTSDLVMLAFSVVTGVWAQVLKVKGKVYPILWTLLLLWCLLCWVFIIVVYCTFYGVSSVPLSIIGMVNIRRVSMIAILCNFVIGLVLSWCED